MNIRHITILCLALLSPCIHAAQAILPGQPGDIAHAPIAIPDVDLRPATSRYVPIPYPNVDRGSPVVEGSRKVKAGSGPIEYLRPQVEPEVILIEDRGRTFQGYPWDVRRP